MLHQIKTEEIGPRGEAMAGAISKCVHCGFCLPACPTYQELESEMDSPRGRILLMKSVLEGELDSETAQPHIDRCLGCLACVSHCPSGVEYGDLINSYRSHYQPARNGMVTLRDRLAAWTLPFPRRFRWAIRLAHWTSFLAKWAPATLKPMLDLVPQDLPRSQRLPELTPAQGTRRGRVLLLAGCAQQVIAPDINASAARVLSLNGFDVLCPSNQSCCGALSWHTGQSRQASAFASRLFGLPWMNVDRVLTTAAGCGSAISEYPLLMKGTEFESVAKRFAQKTSDVSVFLAGLDLEPVPPLRDKQKVAYHDACHLAHAQGVRREPRELLRQIENLDVVELSDPDTCCGSAGTYNIEQPDIARKLGDRKARQVIDTGALTVVTGNIGCLVQLEKHLQKETDRVAVLHTVQVLDRAYRHLFG